MFHAIATDIAPLTGPIDAPTILGTYALADDAARYCAWENARSDYSFYYALPATAVARSVVLSGVYHGLNVGMYEALVERDGWEWDIMGGGMTALRHGGAHGSYALLTCLDGGGMPTADSWHVGVYVPEGEGDALFQMRSDDEGARGATLAACAAAALALIAAYVPADAALIAERFADAIEAYLSPDELELMRAVNATAPAGTCASHDFLDANMPMAEAFHSVTGRQPDPADDDDAALWSLAWDIAHRTRLTATNVKG